MSQVKVFKMLTGEEVLAEVEKTKFGPTGEEVEYVLRRPHTLQFQPIGQGQIGLAFVPWALSNPSISAITVPVSALLIPPFEADTKVETQYLEQTSGISLSASKFMKV
jgi:hypothetical protein